jgi:hypothetical protein
LTIKSTSHTRQSEALSIPTADPGILPGFPAGVNATFFGFWRSGFRPCPNTPRDKNAHWPPHK